ncbi:cobyrinate a,c-diamide synthase [bacterium]|nr:MAG: cobyrinate a,c-diamide synthase [bacterium]
MTGSKKESVARAFIVAGAHSSVGKTVFTLGLMEALRKRGLVVQPFKAGPDYIDAGLHTAVVKKPSYNLDTWMCGVQNVRRLFNERLATADVSIIEGAMGLFDGKDGLSEEGSAGHLAKVLGVPVLLLVNAEKTGRSIAALIKGFESFDRKVNVKWVVFNKVASPRHFEILEQAAIAHVSASVLGFIGRSEGLVLPERHLGLVTRQAVTSKTWKSFIKNAAHAVESGIDVDAFLKSISPIKKIGEAQGAKPAFTKKARLAVAKDSAFCFYYEENIEILKSVGAEVVFFSPLKDRKLPKGTSGIYIGGGYPELYAEGLAKNRALMDEIKSAAVSGMPVYAECGGLMYLGKSIEEINGKAFEMAGVFPWSARLFSKRKAIGYREVIAKDGCPFFKEGSVARGHEFHYSELKKAVPKDIKRAFRVKGAGLEWDEGYMYKNALATYAHLHFASALPFAEGFVSACGEFNKRRKA